MGKLIDADEFIEWLLSDAITDEQRQFAEKVRYAAERMQSATDTNVGGNLIDRQAAIEKVKELCKGCYLSEHCGKCLAKCLVRKAVKILEKVSPAQPEWIPVTERLPGNEQEVFVTVEIRPFGRKPFRRVVRAFYTDGKHTDADSAYTWYELEEPDFDDDGNIIVPEGWWESSDYSEQQEMIDDFIMAWREPLKPWKGGQNAGET